MLDKVRETINKYGLLDRNTHVVLGLSGGPDSVSLFYALRALGYEIHAVHVDHGLRETAARDAAFVQKMCAASGVTCRVVSADCAGLAKDLGMTTEEAGRKIRYEAFCQEADRIREAGHDVKIAVAHNADDQAETVLFRLMRGTGPDGLAGMAHSRYEGGYQVIRPLLDVSRAEIEEYCRANGLEYMTDETNEVPAYTRNSIRLELLPFMREKYNANISEALCRLAAIAGEDKDYLRQQTEAAYEACLRGKVLDRSSLLKLHPSIRRRVLMKAIRMAGLTEDVTYERLEATEEALARNNETRVIQLPKGFEIVIAFDEVRVKVPEDAKDARERTICVDVITDPEEVRRILRQIKEQGYPEDTAVMDADLAASACGVPAEQLQEVIVCRGRQPGDFMFLRGGRKTIKKLLGEMKIPADRRENVTFAARGSMVLALSEETSGKRRFAETLRVNDKTERILTVKFV